MEDLAFFLGQGLDALGRDFIEDAVDFGLVGRRGRGARGVGTLGNIVAQTSPEAAKGGVFEELVDIEKTRKGAGQVGGMGNAGGGIVRQHEFNQRQADNKLPGHKRDGENEEDQEGEPAAGIEGGEGGQNPVNGPGSADASQVWFGRQPKPSQTAQHSTQEIHGQEMLRSHGAFGFGAQEIKREHIEQKVPEAAMEEHVGQWLPKETVANAAEGKCQQIEKTIQLQKPEDEKYDHIGLDKPGRDRGQMRQKPRRAGIGSGRIVAKTHRPTPYRVKDGTANLKTLATGAGEIGRCAGMSDVLLKVEGLCAGFATADGFLRAVDGISFEIRRGEVLGLVGESGCGKTVTALSLLRLLPRPPAVIESGRALFHGQDLLAMPVEELRRIRGSKIGMIFQEPMTALSPLHRIGDQLVEAAQLHRRISGDDAWALGLDWLKRTGLPDAGQRMKDYPHQLSGGMRQRVMLAMTMLPEPELIIADEPTTALDVTIQAQIFELLLKLRGGDTSVLLITHDMGVVWDVCDRVHVMYAGRLVEKGPRDEVFTRPAHPYTRGLLAAMPRLHDRAERLPDIPGQLPALAKPPPGCRFAPRCPLARAVCRAQTPDMRPVEALREVACWDGIWEEAEQRTRA